MNSDAGDLGHMDAIRKMIQRTFPVLIRDVRVCACGKEITHIRVICRRFRD